MDAASSSPLSLDSVGRKGSQSWVLIQPGTASGPQGHVQTMSSRSGDLSRKLVANGVGRCLGPGLQRLWKALGNSREAGGTEE